MQELTVGEGLEEQIKANTIDGLKTPMTGFTSYGLADGNDMTLTNWTASVIHPKTMDMYNFQIQTGPNYPNQAPLVQATGE